MKNETIRQEVKDLCAMSLGIAKYVFTAEGYSNISECYLDFTSKNYYNAIAFVDVDWRTKKVLNRISINPIVNTLNDSEIVDTVVHELLHVASQKRNHTTSFKHTTKRLSEIVWKLLRED